MTETLTDVARQYGITTGSLTRIGITTSFDGRPGCGFAVTLDLRWMDAETYGIHRAEESIDGWFSTRQEAITRGEVEAKRWWVELAPKGANGWPLCQDRRVPRCGDAASHLHEHMSLAAWRWEYRCPAHSMPAMWCRTSELVKACACGKPATHLTADEDGPDWPCRVPEATA